MGKTRSMSHQPISSLLFMKLKVLKHFQSFILLKTIAIDNWMNLDLTQAMEKGVGCYQYYSTFICKDYQFKE